MSSKTAGSGSKVTGLDALAESDLWLRPILLKLARLNDAVVGGKSRVTCLRLWSAFIRERDGHRCVDCHSQEQLSAHHICRKSFLVNAQFDTGNGITLCRQCHREVHFGFNGRPDLTLPVDAQGGEKVELMERLYSILVHDAIERNLGFEKFYKLSDEIIDYFKLMQGYDRSSYFPGLPIEQAYLILAETEFSVRQAIAQVNGFELEPLPILPGGSIVVLDEGKGSLSQPIYTKRYLARS